MALLCAWCLHVAPSAACEAPADCVETGQWQIGVALGGGVRTNPLVGGDNIPLVILPDIAWYGEHAYFDNGELGYQWIDDEQFALETFVAVDTERAFFSFWHPGNVFLPQAGLSVDTPGIAAESDFVQPSVSIDDVATRKWAFLGGVRAHYRFNRSELALDWQSDVSGVHNGSRVTLAYRQHWRLERWQVTLNASMVWKSAKLTNYYYGIGPRDGLGLASFYVGRAGWQPNLRITATRPLTKQWLAIFSAGYQGLHDGMTDSPLVDENHSAILFAGVGYRF